MTAAERKDRVQQLVFRYLERTSAGEPAEAVLDELLSESPAEREELRRAVGALDRAGLLDGEPAHELPERIGEFRVERRLGAGGMGVVLLATQESLGRQVALKLVREDQLYADGSRARFRREIDSAARLSHPGIAQLYSVGESDGVPWFAQEHVPGASLEEVLRALPPAGPRALRGADMREALRAAMAARGDEPAPETKAELFAGTWWAACLGVARQVADALQHAHERGVLHRDVKPSNVLLTPNGRAVLVDFGLAAVTGSDRLTRSGSQVGSLAYTAPEVLDEPRAGAEPEHGTRADAYSLGVTLYELLTRELPFRAASLEGTIARVLAGRPTPPRRLAPEVPPDAETVCLTAMAREPERRYASAAHLAADLASVLARRPISVRPASPLARLAGWARRRPAAATAVALAVLLVVGGPLAFGLQRARVASELRELNTELSAALASEAAAVSRAERHYEVALSAVDEALARLGEERLADAPRLQVARLDVLDRAGEAFDRLQAERPDDLALRERRASLRRARGDVLNEMGRMHEALDEYDAHLALYLELEAAGRDDVFEEVVAALNNKAIALHALGRHEEAHEERLRCEERFRELQRADGVPEAQLPAWTGALSGRSTSERLLGRHDAARELAVEAVARGEDATRALPEDVDAWWRLGGALAELGQVEFETGAPRRGLEHLEAAAPALERALELEPESLMARFFRARVHVRTGRVLHELGELEAAGEQFAAGLDQLGELNADFPLFAGGDDEWLVARDLLSQLLVYRGEWVRSRELLEEVARAREAAAAADPDSLYEVTTAASAFANWSNVVCVSVDLESPARYEASLPITARGLELLEEALAMGPPSDHLRLIATFLHYQHAVALARVGRPDEAIEAVGAMEESQGAGVMPPAYLAEAWAEWQAAELLRDPESAGSASVNEAFERGLEHLRAALEGGTLDPAKIAAQDAFDGWREAPRFVELIEEAGRRRAGR